MTIEQIEKRQRELAQQQEELADQLAALKNKPKPERKCGDVWIGDGGFFVRDNLVSNFTLRGGRLVKSCFEPDTHDDVTYLGNIFDWADEREKVREVIQRALKADDPFGGTLESCSNNGERIWSGGCKKVVEILNELL
jgi:hypothetical protein